MGFSLSRALQGGLMGAANAAGQVYDAQLAEERKQRENEALMARQLELDEARSEATYSRERRRDEDKEALGKRKEEALSSTMKGIRATVKESGVDPDSAAGLKLSAGLADEAGQTAYADKLRTRAETERSHMANEDDRKLRRGELSAARASRRRDEMDDDEKVSAKAKDAVFKGIESQFTIETDLGDGKFRKDHSAVTIASDYADTLFAAGAKPDQVRREVNQLRDVMYSEHSLDPTLRGGAALERGHKRLADDKAAKVQGEKADKSFAKGFNLNEDPTGGFLGQQPTFNSPQGQLVPLPQAPKAAEVGQYGPHGAPTPQINFFTPNTSTRGRTSR